MFYFGKVDMKSVNPDILPKALGAGEKFHAQSLRPGKRLSWIAGRMAAKQAAMNCLKEKGMRVPLNDVEIFSEISGMPVIGGRILDVYPEAAFWRFSISHSYPWAIAALSESPSWRAIGIDVEHVERRRHSWKEIAFHPEEEPYYSENPWVYTSGWTVKEAVLKALGVGLSIDMWDVRLNGGEVTLLGKAMRKFKEMGLSQIRHGSRFDGEWIWSWAVAS